MDELTLKLSKEQSQALYPFLDEERFWLADTKESIGLLADEEAQLAALDALLPQMTPPNGYEPYGFFYDPDEDVAYGDLSGVEPIVEGDTPA